MKRQGYPLERLTAGQDVSVDAVFLTDRASPYLRNIRLDKGLIRKGLGYKKFGIVGADGLPLDGTPMLIDIFPTLEGSQPLLVTTTKWTYLYNADGTYTKKNSEVDTGVISVTFVAATKKITRASGSFLTDGFIVGAIITTDAVLNPGPFTATNVTALEITVSETVVDEGPVSKTVTGMIPYTGDEDKQFCAAVTLDSSGTDIFCLTNGLDYIKKWEGGAVKFTDLLGWKAGDVKAKSIIPFSSRLIAAGTIESGTDCPLRVRWTTAGDCEDISGAGSGFFDLAETLDWCVGLVMLRGKLFVIKERSTWELAYVGGTDVFKPVLRLDGVGSYSPLAIIGLGEEVVLYGTDNVYLYDGVSLTPIGGNIYPLLYETDKRVVNSSKANRVPGVYIEELKEFQMCVPTVGEVPDLIFAYSFDYSAWTLRDKQVTAYGFYSVNPSLTWNQLTGAWNAQTWKWMEKALPGGAPTTLIGTPDGNIWEDDRLTKSTDFMCWDTKDWMFAHSERIVEFRIQAKGGPFTCYYSLDQGETWSSKTRTFGAVSDWTEFSWPLNLTCQSIRMRIESYAEDFDVKWVEPWYIPRVRSKSLSTS